MRGCRALKKKVAMHELQIEMERRRDEGVVLQKTTYFYKDWELAIVKFEYFDDLIKYRFTFFKSGETLRLLKCSLRPADTASASHGSTPTSRVSQWPNGSTELISQQRTI